MTMQNFEFKCESIYNGKPFATFTTTTNEVTLPDILSRFEDFLRGCGFVFDCDAYLEIVEPKELEDYDLDLGDFDGGGFIDEPPPPTDFTGRKL